MWKHKAPDNIPASAAAFGKEQLLKSRTYRDCRDALSALLKDGERYSHADVERLINEFMKGKAM